MNDEKVVLQVAEHHKEKKRSGEIGITWWQLSLIGIGSIVGAGFFLGTSVAISLTGPSVIIAFLIAGLISYIAFTSLAEMKINDLEPGSFRDYARRAFGDSIGFISGWMFWIAGVLIMSSEVTALSVFSRYWFPQIPLWTFSVIYSCLGLGINLLGVKDFGEIESFFAIVKINALALFIIFGILFILGYASPKGSVAGASVISLSTLNWFPKGIKGLWSSMIFALFPYAGVAVVGAASKELKQSKSFTKAINALMLALMFLYITSIVMIFKMAHWQQIQASKSPFITALSAFHVPYIGSIFNIIIVSAAFSTFVGALFAITNVLLSLAKDHEAPKIALKRNKRGVNVIALLIGTSGLLLTILLSFVLPDTIYEYLTTSAGVLLISNWIIILASQIKNRKYYSIKSTTEGKQFKMLFAPYSSYLGILLIILTLIGVTFNPTHRIGLLVIIGIIAIISLASTKSSMRNKKLNS
ncbi:amino acid permease [Clostridium algoriphilum]|uniref:amino acid permease n=1 Tax=Clostridium algoriphilum TaxID=198347 RepID=UPI001CF2EA70|nr:amino acid permease [Clostridium algoriphilum]MCB2294219.1 amino acid permease [Clostridium algoriphilum]